MFNGFLEKTILENRVLDYMVAAGTMAGGILVVWIVKSILLIRIRKWTASLQAGWIRFLLRSVERFAVPVLYFGIFYLAARSLTLHPTVSKALFVGMAMAVTFFGIRFLTDSVHYALFDVVLPKNKEDPGLENRFRALMPAISVAVWVLGVVFLLDNLGFEVSAVVAGLGIGGVAVALAASAVLGDLFAYFAIMFDRPFVLGDFIIVGDFLGSVEHIGIKTTRLRSLGGEQLVFSNKDLTDSRLRNYKRMEQRRVLFKLGVTYGTPTEKLKAAPGMIKAIIEKHPGTRFDRAHFSAYGDFNLLIEVVYYVLSSDYNVYMDTQQAINFAIKEAFEKEGIEFAFPTQTLYLNPAPAAPSGS